MSYTLGLRKKFVSPVPVIVVGNLTVGGTGKTPFTIELADILSSQGYRPGLISRGYKGKVKKVPHQVTSTSDPSWVGDEPVLIASKSNCPIVVAEKRADAIKKLLENNNCNVIISDDGLQHHALKKDVEIVVVDGDRKFGNGWCLPAGPLREPLRKLSKVDFIVYNDNFNSHHYSMKLIPGEIYNLLNPSLKFNRDNTANNIIHAVAAIGHPDRFFNTLKLLGLDSIQHAFPDHHHFREADFDFCGNDECIILTEKDAIKCLKFARANFWVLPVSSQLNNNFQKDFLKKLQSLLPHNESSK